MTRHAIFALLVGALAGCGGNAQPAERPVFGSVEGGCGVTVLTNDIGDEALLRKGVGCLLEAVDARRPVVWDLLAPTVEGDPILYRFEGDGERVTIITDDTRDEFGGSGVIADTCATVDDTGFIPIGVDCTPAGATAFELPEGIWPP